MKLTPFLLISTVISRNMTGSETKLVDIDEVLNPINVVKKIITTLTPTLIPLALKALVFVPAKRKYPPGNLLSSSIKHVKDNFINAYMPLCPAERIAGLVCICRKTYPHLEFIEDEGTRTLTIVAINAKYNQIVVSYRISANVQNWLDNLNIQLTDVAEMPKGVRVHRGIYTDFMGTYTKVQESVIALLDNPKYEDHSLLITGYSLGGAIAQLSVPSWCNLLQSRLDSHLIEVVAYSSPRVGNKAFANYIESFNIPITRYTNQNDLVSHVPGRKQGYVHAGVEVYGSKLNGRYTLRKCSQNYDEDPTCVLGTFRKKSPIPHALPFGKFVPLPPYC